MLAAAALVVLLGWVALFSATVAAVVEGAERRRLRRVAAQIRVTDAVHRALGPIVAPTIVGRAGARWTVAMSLRRRDLAVAGRLTEIVREALGGDGAGVRVVFTPRG